MNAMSTLSSYPDLIFHNAKIYTVDPDRPWASAVAIRKHRIMAVGDDAAILDLAGPETERVDLDGRLLLPGLCDAHIHYLYWSMSLDEVPVSDCTSKAQMLERIARRVAESPPGTWITGQGWNESRWGETRFPTAADLDAVTGPEHPAIFWRSDMHGAVANSAALKLAGIDAATPNPPGGLIERDTAGQPTGVLKELAIGLVADHIPPLDDATRDALLEQGMATLHRLGITAIHDQRMKDHDEGPLSLAAYQRLRRARKLKLRINANIAAHHLDDIAGLGLHTGFGNDYLRLGHVKFFSDGSMGSRTAALLSPFEALDGDDADNTGLFITPPEELATGFRRTAELGFPVSVHAIGDQANRVVLDIFEELADAGLQPTIPHRIEHVQIIDPADLPRLARLGLTASVQPIHVTDDMDTADLYLGERGAHMYNFRTLLDQGTLLVFGSDAPVADPNPFLGLHAAVCRQRVERMPAAPWYGDERISLAEAIHAYTLGAAQAGGWEQVIGSITAGKRADLIVLDRDLFALEAAGVTGDEIAGAQVVMTVFDGEVVWRDDGGMTG
jgi:predicted amidohydrolase YtcJ